MRNPSGALSTSAVRAPFAALYSSAFGVPLFDEIKESKYLPISFFRAALVPVPVMFQLIAFSFFVQFELFSTFRDGRRRRACGRDLVPSVVVQLPPSKHDREASFRSVQRLLAQHR